MLVAPDMIDKSSRSNGAVYLAGNYMPNVVAAALNDAERVGGSKGAVWIIRFITGDGHLGTVVHIGEDIYRLTDEDDGILYFPASAVLYVKPAEKACKVVSRKRKSPNV